MNSIILHLQLELLKISNHIYLTTLDGGYTMHENLSKACNVYSSRLLYSKFKVLLKGSALYRTQTPY